MSSTDTRLRSKVVKFSAYTVYVIERHIQVAIVVKSIYMSSIDIFKWHGGKIKRNTYVIETHV